MNFIFNLVYKNTLKIYYEGEIDFIAVYFVRWKKGICAGFKNN